MTLETIRQLREETEPATPAARAKLSPEELVRRYLLPIYPKLINHLTALTGKAIRIVWDVTETTAATDCISVVRMSPRPFLEGETDVGMGTGYHEGGHCRWSAKDGPWLLKAAERYAGSACREIANIILDRRDDFLTADFAPGFRDALLKRLAYICTLARRERLTPQLRAYLARERGLAPSHPAISETDPYEELQKKQRLETDAMVALIKNAPPKTVYEDFFLAAKWHKAPRFRVTHQAMRLLRRKLLLAASREELLEMTKAVLDSLEDAEVARPEADLDQAEADFEQLAKLVRQIELGLKGPATGAIPITPRLLRAINKLLRSHQAGTRRQVLGQLLQNLKKLRSVPPRVRGSVGLIETVPVIPISQTPANEPAYSNVAAEVAHLVNPLKRQLKRLESPIEFILYRQEDGDLDLSAAARIAAGIGGYCTETVLEREIDVEIHVGVDCSGSMVEDEKIRQAQRLLVLFSEAIQAAPAGCDGHLWAYNSWGVYDLGKPSCQVGVRVIKADGGNSDTHFLTVAGSALIRSPRKRKVLILVCDDGPDDVEKAGQISRELLGQGVLVIHLMVGVDGLPDFYPYELPFREFEDLLADFGDLIVQLLANLR